MTGLPFTLAVFEVEAQHHAAFVAAWEALCEAFRHLPHPPAGPMTLIQSHASPNVFQSLGPWRSLEDVHAMRADATVAALMRRMVALASSARPGEFTVVRVVG